MPDLDINDRTLEHEGIILGGMWQTDIVRFIDYREINEGTYWMITTCDHKTKTYSLEIIR